MPILIADRDFRLVSRIVTDLNDAGLWALRIEVDDARIVMPRLRRPPRALIADVDGGRCGTGLEIAQHARRRWPRLTVLLTGAPQAGEPLPLDPRENFVAKPFEKQDLLGVLHKLLK